VQITLLNFSLLILITLVISTSGAFVVRHFFDQASLRSHHDVTDPLLAVIGTLFAILLGFMLANSMQRFEQARTNVEREAEGLGDIFRLSDALPTELKTKIRKSCVDYTNTVIVDEWPKLQSGKVSPQAGEIISDLWQECIAYQPVTQGQSNVHQIMLQAMQQTGECRRTRLAELKYTLPPTLWLIIIFGGLTTIVFTFFFAIKSLRLQILMTSIVTTLICLNIYVLAGYDAPFSGDIALTTAPFEVVRDLMQRRMSKAQAVTSQTAKP
jgi:hypothetical protein